MNRYSDDNDQSDNHFATPKPDDFGRERLHYRREWYVDPHVGYWLGEQGLVRAGHESCNGQAKLKVFDPTD